jgi:hypothetical protein
LIERFNERLEILDRETRVLADKPAIFGLLACGHVAAWVRTTDDPHWRIDTKFALRWVGVHGDDRTDVALTRELLSHIDRLNAAALALRTKVPRKLAGAVEPAQ